jgi:hypothetical protein
MFLGGVRPLILSIFRGFQKGQGAGKVGAGDKRDGKKRKPYTVNGKTVMMTGLFRIASLWYFDRISRKQRITVFSPSVPFP